MSNVRPIVRTHAQALSAALLTLVSACSSGEVAAPVAPQAPPALPALQVFPTPPPPPPEPTETPEQIAARKAGAVTSCLNLFNDSMHQAHRAYVDRMGDDPEPSHSDWSNPSSLNNLHASSVPQCRSEVDRALAITPAAPELDAVLTAYITSLETLTNLATETKTYFEREANRDDGGAQGRALHPQMLAAFEAYFTADRALRDQVSAVERREMETMLAELAAAPDQHARYLVERTRACAMSSLDAITALRVERAGRQYAFASDQEEALLATVAACQVSTDEMIADPAVLALSGGGSFAHDAGDLIAASMIVARALREDTSFRSESAAMQQVNAVISEYNSLVDDYNGLRF